MVPWEESKNVGDGLVNLEVEWKVELLAQLVMLTLGDEGNL